MIDEAKKRDLARQTLWHVAQGMLNGRIQLIEGCRSLVRLRSDAELPPSGAFDLVVSIESDTDDCPLGSIRAEYASELLERLDAKVQRILAKDTPILLEACRSIISQLELLQLRSGKASIQ